MKFLPKILTTIAIIGFILLAFAAGFQNFNRPLADNFGYLGLSLLGFNVVVMGSLTIVAVWSKRFKSYILSSI